MHARICVAFTRQQATRACALSVQSFKYVCCAGQAEHHHGQQCSSGRATRACMCGVRQWPGGDRHGCLHACKVSGLVTRWPRAPGRTEDAVKRVPQRPGALRTRQAGGLLGSRSGWGGCCMGGSGMHAQRQLCSRAWAQQGLPIGYRVPTCRRLTTCLLRAGQRTCNCMPRPRNPPTSMVHVQRLDWPQVTLEPRGFVHAACMQPATPTAGHLPRLPTRPQVHPATAALCPCTAACSPLTGLR